VTGISGEARNLTGAFPAPDPPSLTTDREPSA